jgi:hypothetical protein
MTGFDHRRHRKKCFALAKPFDMNHWKRTRFGSPGRQPSVTGLLFLLILVLFFPTENFLFASDANAHHVSAILRIDGEPATWYADLDQDGFGDPLNPVVDTLAPEGFIADGTDCNDLDPAMNPGMTETCNGIDDDCSGIADDHPEISAIVPSWQKALGGSRDDECRSVIACSGGGYLIAGSTNSTDGDVTASFGKKDAWLVRLDGNGNVLWQQAYGGSGDDFANVVRQTSDGGFLFSGPSNTMAGGVTGGHGSQDFWVVKTDSIGAVVWQKCYGGTLADVPLALDLAPDGGYVIAGTTYSNDGDVSGNHGGGDYWLIKIDSAGTLIWQKAFGGTAYDFAHAVAADRDSGYILSGYARSGNGDVLLNNGQEDMWILKLDRNGNLLWQKSYGGTGGEGALAVRQTTEGGFVLTGTTHSFNIDVVGSHGGHDVWVVKINSTGDLEWTRCLGGSSHDDAADLQLCDDGGFVIAGITTSADGDVTVSRGMEDYWMVKLNETGSLEWQVTAGGTDEDISCSIDQDDAGNFILAGYTSSVDGDVTGSHGKTDAWVVKVAPPAYSTFYLDADGDSFGTDDSVFVACTAPDGFVANHNDCNDFDFAVFPGQTEICNGIDDNCNSYTDENGVAATISPLATVTVCSSSLLVLTCNNSGEGYSYQWKKYGVDLPGATDPTYQVNSPGAYSVELISGGCTSNSPATIIKFTDPVAPISPSGTITSCNNKSVNFSTSEFAGMMFQWYTSSEAIPGATRNNYTASGSGSYSVQVSDITGCSFTSSTATMQVNAAPVTSLTVTGSTNICNSGSVTFSVPYTYGNLYQWQKDNAAISGATLNSYTATEAGTYKVLVSTSQGCTKYSTSKTVKSCRTADGNLPQPYPLDVFPNPASRQISFRVPDELLPAEVVTIRLVSPWGETVLTEQLLITDAQPFLMLELPEHLPPGVCHLLLSTAWGGAATGFVVMNR